jgi:hypothetical protein
MNRFDTIGNINRKYADSGMNPVITDASETNINVRNGIKSITGGSFHHNPVGTLALNNGGRTSIEQATRSHKESFQIANNVVPYPPTPSQFNSTIPNKNPSRQLQMTDQDANT